MNKSGMLAIITTLSIAMLGATIMVSYGALQAEAKSGTSVDWCYSQLLRGNPCLSNHGECNKAQASNALATSGCIKQKHES